MAGNIGGALEKLPQDSSAKPALEVLRRVFSDVVQSPLSPARWSPQDCAGCSGPALAAIRQTLLAAGFVEAGGALQLTPGAGNVDEVQDSLDLIDCMLVSFEEEPKPASPSAMEVDPDMDPELAEALRMSMGGAPANDQSPTNPEAKRPRQEETDAEVAQRLATEEDDDGEEHVDIEFERIVEEDVLITEEAVKEINEYCAAAGEPYVDPQFPPVNRSLYVKESDGVTWECFACRTRSPLPPVPPMPTSQEELDENNASFERIKCQACGAKAPFVVKQRYFSRPCDWLRPGVKCDSCLMNAPYEWPGIPNPEQLIQIMCTHYLRSKSTRKTLGQPWKVIRDQPRPEDVQQGALGNCWFGAALSMVAAKPNIIWNLFISREFNPHGAYQLQLFHSGYWRGILIDDLFPTTKVSPGKRIPPDKIRYSLGGELSYTTCGRHQLWVPLVEKAAAKLAGSYGHLSGGTFSQALAMFTGFPTETIPLAMSLKMKEAMAERRQKKIEARTQMLLRGEMPPEEDDEDDEEFKANMLWSRMLSFKEAGYLMGLACLEQPGQISKEAFKELGLSPMHAYGIMDVREVRDSTGQIVRLVQIRNPWGEMAPITWQGDWGKDSSKWTYELKRQLGVVNSSNVTMYDQMSIFWMTFEDMKKHFITLDICRVHEGWEEYRERAWLPSGVGPGEAFDLVVYEKTQVDIGLWQEKHIKRASALGGSTNVDVGFVVLRRRGDNEDGTPDYECLEYRTQSSDDCVSQEMILEGGFVYKIVPLCFNQLQQFAPRQIIAAVQSANPVTLRKVPSSYHTLATAAVLGTFKKGQTPLASAAIPGAAQLGHLRNVRLGILHSAAGIMLAVENASDQDFGMQFDGEDCMGCVSSREGACGCIDNVPPRSRKFLICVTPKQGARAWNLSNWGMGLMPEAAAWAVPCEDVHMVLPLPPLAHSAALAADPVILSAERPQRHQRPLHARGGQKIPEPAGAEEAEAEAALAEALRLSMEGEGDEAMAASPSAGDEDEQLAAAIRMSMVQPAGQPAAATAPPSAEPAAGAASLSSSPPAGDASANGVANGSKLVKELFEGYRKEGVAPNEAAAKATEEAKRRSSGPVAQQDIKLVVKELFEQYRAQGMPPNEAAAKAMQEARSRAAAS